MPGSLLQGALPVEAPGAAANEPTVLGVRPKPALFLLIVAAVILPVIGYGWCALGAANGGWPTFSAPIVYRVGVAVVLMLFIPFTPLRFSLVRRVVPPRPLP